MLADTLSHHNFFNSVKVVGLYLFAADICDKLYSNTAGRQVLGKTVSVSLFLSFSPWCSNMRLTALSSSMLMCVDSLSHPTVPYSAVGGCDYNNPTHLKVSFHKFIKLERFSIFFRS